MSFPPHTESLFGSTGILIEHLH